MWCIKIFLGSNHITGTAKPKLVKCCTQVGYINYGNPTGYDISPTKGAWSWSRDYFKILPFAVMQLIGCVCQRQLSYLLPLQSIQSFPYAVRSKQEIYLSKFSATSDICVLKPRVRHSAGAARLPIYGRIADWIGNCKSVTRQITLTSLSRSNSQTRDTNHRRMQEIACARIADRFEQILYCAIPHNTAF